jgi:hypothetical protein
MPQLQKAMPVTAAPLRKCLRVVMGLSLKGETASPGWPIDCRRPVFDFFTRHIAKPKAKGQ